MPALYGVRVFGSMCMRAFDVMMMRAVSLNSITLSPFAAQRIALLVLTPPKNHLGRSLGIPDTLFFERYLFHMGMHKILELEEDVCTGCLKIDGTH